MDTQACRELRERALIDAGTASSLPHSRDCGACAAWLRGLDAREAALRALTRLAAPPELAGRAVAAVQAGARQERATQALRSLGRLTGPVELERALGGPAGVERTAAGPTRRLAAPRVLDRLVDEELRDPVKARIARQLRALERVAVPAELDQRVDGALAGPTVRAWASRLPWTRIAAAAALVVAVVVPLVLYRNSPPARPFRVERLESFETLSATSRAWIDTASSGLLSQNKL